jgi:hypothetical protein
MIRVAVVSVVLAASASAALRVGAGAVKITPPPGAPMAGCYYNQAADGVRMPIDLRKEAR